MDGSGSYDLDSNDLVYEWSWEDGVAYDVNSTVMLPLGQTMVTLLVTDGFSWDTDTVNITVVDMNEIQVSIIVPEPNAIVQDGITLAAEANSNNEVDALHFYIRESNDGNGIPIGYDALPAVFDGNDDQWKYYLDTTELSDGNYVVFAKAYDIHGKEGASNIVPFSVQNWQMLELLRHRKKYKPGRTIPIKFTLRVSETIDIAMPFVYNEDLIVKIYKVRRNRPNLLLQTSRFGDHSKDYRISTGGEFYITNFKTRKKPARYLVKVYRSGNFLIGKFRFRTRR
jgi:hypothetical protein